jgi:hypothetical protein
MFLVNKFCPRSAQRTKRPRHDFSQLLKRAGSSLSIALCPMANIGGKRSFDNYVSAGENWAEAVI